MGARVGRSCMHSREAKGAICSRMPGPTRCLLDEYGAGAQGECELGGNVNRQPSHCQVRECSERSGASAEETFAAHCLNNTMVILVSRRQPAVLADTLAAHPNAALVSCVVATIVGVALLVKGPA